MSNTPPLTAPSLVGTAIPTGYEPNPSDVMPGAPASGPDPAAQQDIVAVIGTVIQDRIDAAVDGMRQEFQQALDGLGDQVVQVLENYRQGFAQNLTQLGANQATLNSRIQEAGGITEGRARELIMEGIRDFFMMGVREWAMWVAQNEEPIPEAQTPEPAIVPKEG